MLVKSSLLLLVFAVANAKTTVRVADEYRLTESVYPKNFEKLKTLVEFVKIVEKYHMNVSLILSSGVNYKNGNLKEVVAMTLTFPVNSDALNNATGLNSEDFINLVKAATKDKLAISGTSAKNNEMEIGTNYPEGIPVNKAIKIFTGIKNGKTGFVFDEENYMAQYTFFTPGEDGHNKTTKVLHGDIDVEVVEAKNVPEEVVEVVKNAVISSYFTYEDEDFGRAVSDILEDKTKESWEVVGEVDENSYIDAKKSVLLKILNYNYLLYVI